MKLKALFFDAGNVLYHRPRRNVRLKAFLSENELSFVPSSDPSRVELKQRVHLGQITETTYYDALLDLFGVSDPLTRPEGRHILYEEERDIVFFDGVGETLRHLKGSGFLLGVITNTYVSTNETIVWFTQEGFGSVWDSFANSRELGIVKPDPQIYLAALKPLELQPTEAGFVGHAAIELKAAKELGMTTIVFNRDDPGVKADYTIKHFTELIELTNTLRGEDT